MSDFWRGVCVAFCYQQLVQDVLGKEKYLKTVDVLWVNTHWSLWAILAILFLSIPTIEKQINRSTKPKLGKEKDNATPNQ